MTSQSSSICIDNVATICKPVAVAATSTFTLRAAGNMARIEEGVLLRNVSAAPICNHFTVVAPGCWIREPVPLTSPIFEGSKITFQ